MSAGGMVGACLAATVVIILVASWALNLRTRTRDRRCFQRTAKQAARTETTVAEDVATKKASRNQNEAAEDMATCLAIWDITPHDIPHQTRRTEDPQ